MTRIAVIGAGAMGGLYASKLQAVPDAEVCLVAAGERAERLRAEGLTINGQRHDFPVVEPGAATEPAELVVVAVKYPALTGALDQLAGQIGPGTIVISLLNGITSEAEIAARFPEAHVLLSMTVEVDPVRHGSTINYTRLGRIDLGEARNPIPWSEPVRFVTNILSRAGLVWQVPEDMTRQLWWKFLINVGVNQVTAVLGAPYAVVQRVDSPARALMLAAQREVIAVAQEHGVDLGSSDLGSWLEVLARLGPGQYTSMAQDVLAGRPTEADVFGGVMRRLGAEVGVPVPVNTVLHQLLTARDQLLTAGDETVDSTPPGA